MKILKRTVLVIVLLCVALSLSATKNPKEAKASVPPGITEADWHSINDDFGFVLRITRSPLVLLAPRQDGNLFTPDNFQDELRRQVSEQRRNNAAESETTVVPKNKTAESETTVVPKNRIGQAEAVFFARKGETWYTITTPPSPIRPHFIQQ